MIDRDKAIEAVAQELIYVENPTWMRRWGWTEWMHKDETRAKAARLVDIVLDQTLDPNHYDYYPS
jgi:hypothetical protein